MHGMSITALLIVYYIRILDASHAFAYPQYTTYGIVQQKYDKLHKVLYCATSLSQLRLCVDVIVLNLNELVRFMHCTWVPRTRLICLNKYILVGCKHRASEGVFYTGGRGCVLCQFIEPVTFARCMFIFALQNIALGRYLDTRRNI